MSLKLGKKRMKILTTNWKI